MWISLTVFLVAVGTAFAVSQITRNAQLKDRLDLLIAIMAILWAGFVAVTFSPP